MCTFGHRSNVRESNFSLKETLFVVVYYVTVHLHTYIHTYIRVCGKNEYIILTRCFLSYPGTERGYFIPSTIYALHDFLWRLAQVQDRLGKIFNTVVNFFLITFENE